MDRSSCIAAVFERLQALREALLRAVEPNACRDARAAERSCGVGEREPFPCDEGEHLPVTGTKAGECLGEGGVADEASLLDRRLGRGTAGTRLALVGPTGVGERLPRDAVEPRQRLRRQAIELSPADEERLRGHLLGDLLRRAA